MDELTHVDEGGRARMVDVSGKADTERLAIAEGCVRMRDETISLIEGNQIAKGEVLTVAKAAGILGAKRASSLIPMCHPIPLSHIQLSFSLNQPKGAVGIRCEVKSIGKTGVEMEALTGVCTSALTIYDMCKVVDKGMTISDVCLIEKRGGKSGNWHRRR